MAKDYYRGRRRERAQWGLWAQGRATLAQAQAQATADTSAPRLARAVREAEMLAAIRAIANRRPGYRAVALAASAKGAAPGWVKAAAAHVLADLELARQAADQAGLSGVEWDLGGAALLAAVLAGPDWAGAWFDGAVDGAAAEPSEGEVARPG